MVEKEGRGRKGVQRRSRGKEDHFFSNTLTLFFHYDKSEPKVNMFRTNS